MKKHAKDLKVLDKIEVAGQKCSVKSIEFSEVGKQGKRKARIELITEKDEKIIIIRPEDYPFETI